MYKIIEKELEKSLPKKIVQQLLETYKEVKRNYFLGNLRIGEVEGGRFSEAVFRLLEYITTKKFTPLDKQIKDFANKCRDLENLPSSKFSESIRIHIPRTIRLVYDIRNKRDAAHLSDGIDPNLQDSTFVVGCCDWVLAEFIRLFYGASSDQAQTIVEKLITRQIPVIEEFGTYIKTLNPKLKVSERVLVLLYHKDDYGATQSELESWLKPEQLLNLPRTLTQMEHEKDWIVKIGQRYTITRRGIMEVDRRKLLHIE